MTRNGKIIQYSIWPNIMKAILISTVVLAHSNHMPYEIGKIIYWFLHFYFTTNRLCLYYERNKHNRLVVRYKKSHSAVCDWVGNPYLSL